MKFWESWRRFIENQRGAYLVIVAVLLPLLLTFAGLAVDLGRGYAHKAKLQNAADAGVMAAAHIYFPDKSHDEVYEWAQRYMDANHGNEAYNIDQITVRTLKEENNSGDQEGTVLLSLYASEKVPVSFMAVMGFDAMPVNVVATAKVTPKEDPKDPGVWGYAFICGDGTDADHCDKDMDQSHIGRGAPFRVTDSGHRIIGKVHTNGAVAVTGGAGTAFWNDGPQYSVFVEPGNFSTSIKDDIRLWKNFAECDGGHWGAWPEPWPNPEGKSQKPWYDNDVWDGAHWRSFVRFGYYENGPGKYIGTDVVASKAYTGNIDISLSKTNSQTEAIYDYVDSLVKKYGNRHKEQDDGIFIETDGRYGGDTRIDTEYFNSNGGKKYATIIADGSINISQEEWLQSADYLTIISLHGDVSIGSTTPIKALIYAPNGQAYIIGGHGTDDHPSFEGSVVAKYITLTTQHQGEVVYKWNDFGFGTGSGSGSSGSGSGSSSGTGGVESIILYKDEDPNYGNEQAI